MSVLLAFTRDDVSQASKHPVIKQESAGKAFKAGDSKLLKLWVARAIHRQMLTTISGPWHWAKRRWSGLSRHEYAVGLAYEWLKDNPVTSETA